MADGSKRNVASLKLKHEKTARLIESMGIDEPPAPSPAVIKPEAQEVGIEVMEDGTELAVVNRSRLVAIKKLGVDVDGLGALPLANGFCVMSKLTLAKVCERITAVIDDSKNPELIIDGARAIAYCANTMAKLLGESRQINAMKKAPQGPRNKSFTPGQAVAVQVNIQNQIANERDHSADH